MIQFPIHRLAVCGLASSTKQAAILQSLGQATQRPWPCRLLLAAWCSVLFFYGLSTGDLWRTEGLRAQVAADFLHSGDWVVPRLYGQPLLTKPPGMYVAIALASWPFGEVREWTARLPSGLGATATVLLFSWYFTRQLGRSRRLDCRFDPARFGDVAGQGHPGGNRHAARGVGDGGHSIFLARWNPRKRRQGDKETGNGEGRNVGLPSPFPVPRSPLLWWLAALLCVAGGVLTKWTAPAFFYLTVLTLLWRRRRLRLLWGWHHLVSAGVAAAVCLAWAAAAMQRVGLENLVETVGREAMARLAPDRYGRPYPWWEVPVYPIVIFVVNLPWSAFALLTLWPGFAQRWDERGRRLLEALHCWLWPNVCMWSLVSEHAPRHGFPIYPAVAGFAALVWIAWIDGRLAWPFRHARPGPVLAGLLVLWLGVKLVFVQVIPHRRNAVRARGVKAEQLARLVPEGQTLYLFDLKDRNEAMMFYYGRQVQRLPKPEALPPGEESAYCLLGRREWREWPATSPAEARLWLRDELSDWIVLVRVSPCLRTVSVNERLPQSSRQQ